jgi:hypothetical protein
MFEIEVPQGTQVKKWRLERSVKVSRTLALCAAVEFNPFRIFATV